MDPDEFKFEGTINYDIVMSKCAVLSKAPWAVMPNGGSAAEEPEDSEPEISEEVYEPEEDPNDTDPPIDGGGPSGGVDPPEEDIM